MKKLFLGLLCIMAYGYAQAQLISVAPASIEQGAESALEVVLTNGSMSVNTIGLNIYLPDALEFVLSDGQITGSLTNRAVDHTISCAKQNDGSGYYLIMSMTNAGLKGTDGAVFTIPVKAVGAVGTYKVKLNNIEVVDAALEAHRIDTDIFFDVNVVAAEAVRYTDNQLYAKDITINQGENTVLQVYYNSLSDLHEYSTAIALPAGVTVGSITYTEVFTSVNYSTEDSYANGVLTLSGEQSGTAKKPKPAEAGNHVFAEVVLNTASLAAGVYNIVLGSQYLSNEDDENDGEYSPVAYTAKLTVVGSAPAVTSWDLVDAEVYDNDTNYYNIDITYTRNFKNTSWQALYVPFNMSYDEWSAYVDIAEVHNVRGYDYDNDNVLDEIVIEFNKLGEGSQIVPNVPYVIRAKKKAEVTFECTGKTLLAAPTTDKHIECASTKMTYSFHGVYQPTTGLYEQGAYRLTGGAFCQYATSAGKLDPYRFYMLCTPKTDGYNTTSLPQQIKIHVIGDDEDDTDSIDAIDLDTPSDNTYYDLLGRPVHNPTPGIYIHNGHKVLIK